MSSENARGGAGSPSGCAGFAVKDRSHSGFVAQWRESDLKQARPAACGWNAESGLKGEWQRHESSRTPQRASTAVRGIFSRSLLLQDTMESPTAALWKGPTRAATALACGVGAVLDREGAAPGRLLDFPQDALLTVVQPRAAYPVIESSSPIKSATELLCSLLRIVPWRCAGGSRQ